MPVESKGKYFNATTLTKFIGKISYIYISFPIILVDKFRVNEFFNFAVSGNVNVKSSYLILTQRKTPLFRLSKTQFYKFL
jgi:hypothetical protein